MGRVATKPLLPGVSPSLHSGRQNKSWPTKGHGGCITPTAWGAILASRRGTKSRYATRAPRGYITPAACVVPIDWEGVTKSNVAHKWAGWMHHPCRLGGSHRLRVGDKIKGGPQVGPLAA